MKIIVSLFLLLCSLPCIAKPKVAVVDMNEVFAKYHLKLKIEQDVQEQIEALKTSSRVVAVQEMDSKLKEIAKTVRDKTLPAETRELAAIEFNSLAIEHQALLQEMEQFLSNAKRQATHDLVETLEELISRVSKQISLVSKQEGFDLVLESGGKTSSQVSPIIYLREKTDITELVIEGLNKDAPSKGQEQEEK